MDSRRYKLVIVFVVSILMLLVFGAVCASMFKIQSEREEWIQNSGDYARKESLEATRGNIFSSDGQLLASSIPYYEIRWDADAEKTWRDTFPKYADTLSLELSKVLKEKSAAGWKNYLMDGYNKRNRHLLIESRVSYNDTKKIKQMPYFKYKRGYSGLKLEEKKRRNNPFGEIAALGKISQAERGNRGIELKYDSILKGEDGLGLKQKIAGVTEIYPLIESKDGMDLVTTLDGEIQDIARQALEKEMKRINAINGCMVLMEVESGEVKACVNLQKLNDGSYYDGTNVAVERFEPGSTFKTISMMVALEDGVVKVDDTVDAMAGVKEMYGVRMTDSHPNGILTMQGVIEQSSNIGMSTVIDNAYHNNPDKFIDAIYNLGITQDMKLEIWGYKKPYIKKKSDPNSKWSAVSLPFISIGYETEISPIYMLSFYNAIANDGKLIKPIFVREVQNNGKVVSRNATEVMNARICSPTTLATIRKMLEGVVLNGTGKPVRSNKVTIAGKTGTAQADNKTAHRVTFCGYFPADKPKYSGIVMMYAKGLGNAASGGGMSGAVFKEVAEKVHARKIAYNPQEMATRREIESQKPLVKNGNVRATARVLGDFHVKYTGCNGRWCVTEIDDDKVTMSDLALTMGEVPNVIGMGANDAVYLMETAGIRTSITGKGKVVSQSITAGSQPHKGDIVYLTLR